MLRGAGGPGRAPGKKEQLVAVPGAPKGHLSTTGRLRDGVQGSHLVFLLHGTGTQDTNDSTRIHCGEIPDLTVFKCGRKRYCREAWSTRATPRLGAQPSSTYRAVVKDSWLSRQPTKPGELSCAGHQLEGGSKSTPRASQYPSRISRSALVSTHKAYSSDNST